LSYEHVPHVSNVLQKLVETYERDDWEEWEPEKGEPNYRRLMLLMPRRYFKSEIISRRFSSYFLYRFPQLWVGLTSYEAYQSYSFSRKARENFRKVGGQLRGDSQAVHLWETPKSGGLWATGTGGPLLGKGYHLGVLDDPIKPQEAHSITYQRQFAEWYPGTFFTGQEPGASIIIIMQRLSPLDPISFLWERELEEPENWHIVCLDEIHSDAPFARYDGPMGLPSTCTYESDWREVGEVLAPSRFSEANVFKKHRNAGIYVSSSQFQQRPAAPAGDFWKREWFDVYDKLPEDAHNGGKDWDTAYTKDEKNAASAFIESYRGPGPDNQFPIYIEDVDWLWCKTPALIDWMLALSGPHHIEAKASGKSAAQFLDLHNVMVYEVQVTGGDKMARSSTVQPIVANRRVKINRRVYNKLLEGKHANPICNGRQGLLAVTAEGLATESGDLDVNDAFVQAINRHTKHTDWSGTTFTANY